jgi:hypothetical protein
MRPRAVTSCPASSLERARMCWVRSPWAMRSAKRAAASIGESTERRKKTHSATRAPIIAIDVPAMAKR